MSFFVDGTRIQCGYSVIPVSFADDSPLPGELRRSGLKPIARTRTSPSLDHTRTSPSLDCRACPADLGPRVPAALGLGHAEFLNQEVCVLRLCSR